YTDLPLLPEAVRFVWSTRSFWQFSLGLIGVLVGLVALGYGSYKALRVVDRYLRETEHIYIGAALIGVTYLANTARPTSRAFEELYSGGFAASAFPRIQRELEFIANVRSEKAAQSRRIAETERMIAELPSDLARLKKADVHLILVESYGRCTFELPEHARDTRPVFDAFESELTKLGFTIATGMLNSSTYGGRSWLAHATLNTAVPTTNQFEYDLVVAKKPKPLASYFKQAGYRTVLVQPGTTRDSPQGDIYGFDQKYYSWMFGYQGPKFGWATMADQYVLDFVRRKELAGKKQPLFIEYALVTSHAPWNAIPSIVPDWSRIGDGRIFGELPVQRFPIEWPHFDNAGYAYAKTIIYDFEVLRRFIAEFIRDGSLLVILGDHQPVWEVNGGSAEFGVPIHVLSRDAELVRPFLARGYVPGIRPQLANYNEGLEKFYPYLLLDFSTPKLLQPP
ncbi:MAG TPA: sulfatase-like hydrolase/transferase, partial [Polyangiaceae bacterium]